MRRAAVICCLAVAAAPVQAADYYFCWQGANGYTMTGQMSLAPLAGESRVATEADVTLFRIAGFLNGDLLGKWDAMARDPDDTWFLNFDVDAMSFLTPEQLGAGISQAWNANGDTDNCGTPGFGFNLGNYAQDFCLNSTWVVDSGVPPETPFVAGTLPIDPSCRVYSPMS